VETGELAVSEAGKPVTSTTTAFLQKLLETTQSVAERDHPLTALHSLAKKDTLAQPGSEFTIAEQVFGRVSNALPWSVTSPRPYRGLVIFPTGQKTKFKDR
jgi:hypothetical protein